MDKKAWGAKTIMTSEEAKKIGPQKPNGPIHSIRAWLKLVRIEHALMSAVAVLISMLLVSVLSENGAFCPSCAPRVCDCVVGLSIPILSLPFALFVPFFINLAAFALNDYWDIEADKKNWRKERPLVSGALKPAAAVWTAILGYLIGITAGWLINPVCGIIATLFALASIAYNRWLKDLPLLGNLYIAASMAIAFPFGVAVFGPGNLLPGPILWLTLGAFLAGFARELVKSVQDMEGDKAARNSRHLPILIGARPTLVLAGLLSVGFCASLFMLASSPYLKWNVLELGFLAISGLAYLTIAFELLVGMPNAEAIERLRKTTLYALGLALLAMALAAIM